MKSNATVDEREVLLLTTLSLFFVLLVWKMGVW